MDLHSARSTVLNFGFHVRAQRLAVGLSQQELGRRARVTANFIGKMERGTSNPSLVTMALVAAALGCSLAELLQADAMARTPHKSTQSVSLSADDMRRAQQAAAIIASVLTPKRARRLRRHVSV